MQCRIFQAKTLITDLKRNFYSSIRESDGCLLAKKVETFGFLNLFLKRSPFCRKVAWTHFSAKIKATAEQSRAWKSYAHLSNFIKIERISEFDWLKIISKAKKSLLIGHAKLKFSASTHFWLFILIEISISQRWVISHFYDSKRPVLTFVRRIFKVNVNPA